MILRIEIAIIVLISILIFGCKQESRSVYYVDEGIVQDNETKKVIIETAPLDSKYFEIPEVAAEIFKDVSYTLKQVNALDFLARKKVKIDSIDFKDLEKETVIILEYNSLKLSKPNIFDLKQLSIPKSKALEYLSFHVQNDLYAKQDSVLIRPNGVELEKDYNLGSRIRVLAFFSSLDNAKPFDIHLNDKIFGANELTFDFSPILQQNILEL